MKAPEPRLSSKIGFEQTLGDVSHHLHVDTLASALVVGLSLLGIRKPRSSNLKEHDAKRKSVDVFVVALACEKLGLSKDRALLA